MNINAQLVLGDSGGNFCLFMLEHGAPSLVTVFIIHTPQEKEKKKPRGHRNVIQLRETCHSEAVTDVTAVGIRIQNVRENGLPRQSADWLAMTKPLT